MFLFTSLALMRDQNTFHLFNCYIYEVAFYNFHNFLFHNYLIQLDATCLSNSSYFCIKIFRTSIAIISCYPRNFYLNCV